MRSVEEIRNLRKELGRREERLKDREEEMKKLREQLEGERAGGRELRQAADALLTAAVLAWGEETQGEKRLTLPRFGVGEMQEGYILHARRDPAGEDYILSVRPRGEGA